MLPSTIKHNYRNILRWWWCLLPLCGRINCYRKYCYYWHILQYFCIHRV